MTRLFFRFYIGVVLILVVAWLVQSYVTRVSNVRQNVSVIEDALAGGLRLARDQLSGIPEDQAADRFRQIVSSFEYPVNLMPMDIEWLGPREQNRLIDGETVLLGDYIAIALPSESRQERTIADDLHPTDTSGISSDQQDDKSSGTVAPKYFLLFGPLPQFVGPSRADVSIGYGIIFLLAALAIAVLLRPVAKQFRDVERTATAISRGDLSARIQTGSRSRNFALVNAFNTMAERTESLLRSQRELLQAVSHELRTPLARIRFATDLVETAMDGTERRKRLDSIDNATEKLDALVGELLTYTRIESDASSMTPETVDIWNLIEEAVDFHAPLYPGIEFVLPENPQRILALAHHTSLARAVENLIRNAGQHAKSRVSASAEIEGDGLQLHIDDDGKGIPEADREKVLEPFVRLENTDRRGSGLGLAIAQRIAKQHKGEITISESKLGGARMTIHLSYQDTQLKLGSGKDHATGPSKLP